MLRSRPARVLPPLAASRQSQRLLWSHPFNIMAWLGHGDTQSSKSSSNPTKKPFFKSNTQSNCVAGTQTHVLRPQPSVDAFFPARQEKLNSKAKRDAVRALDRLTWKAKHASTPKQLLDAWKIISQYRPFVVQKNRPFQVELASATNVHGERALFLQLVPANVFAELSANKTRLMFLGSTKIDRAPVNVVVTNEAFMVETLVKKFYRMDEHKLVVSFFEAYDRKRNVWLQEHQLRAAATVPDDGPLSDDEKEEKVKSDDMKKQMTIEEVTRLPHVVVSCYLRSLVVLRQPRKIVQLFENDERQLERICATVPGLFFILHACFDEKNGALAGRAIDTISKCSPVAVIPLGCYELAIQANLHDRKRDERALMTAIYLARTLLNDGGYILKPKIWSRLIKMSLDMDRPDLALDVFKTYPRHCVPEYQKKFRQVLQITSRLAESTALEMMRFCWVSYDAGYPNRKVLLDERKSYKDAICLNNLEIKGLSLGDAVLAPNIPAVNKEAETEMLNTMLWELLKHRDAVPSVVQVLDLMEATRSKGGGGALRKAVVNIFEYVMKEKKMSPRAALESSLKFWRERSSVLYGQGFLVHLLLEECLEHLNDESEFLVNYLLDNGVRRVPINSIVKMMEVNELRGRFKANAYIGDKLLQKLSYSDREKLRNDFFERYLMSYLRLEQFDKVVQQYANFKLGQRYPHNEVIRKIMQAAATQ